MKCLKEVLVFNNNNNRNKKIKWRSKSNVIVIEWRVFSFFAKAEDISGNGAKVDVLNRILAAIASPRRGKL